MATPKDIPSTVNSAASQVSAAFQKQLYITAMLQSSTLTVTITGAAIDCGSPGPVALPSPIVCDSFTPGAIGQIAYYEQ
jgi:hypothetical protein